jgi:hypothetical protein
VSLGILFSGHGLRLHFIFSSRKFSYQKDFDNFSKKISIIIVTYREIFSTYREDSTLIENMNFVEIMTLSRT